MVKVIIRESKISHILFGIGVIGGFLLSWYFDSTILLILSTVYSIVLYVYVPRHKTKEGQKVTFTKGFTLGGIVVQQTTFTAGSEKALKAKILNFEKTHRINNVMPIEKMEKDGITKYSAIVNHFDN